MVWQIVIAAGAHPEVALYIVVALLAEHERLESAHIAYICLLGFRQLVGMALRTLFF